MAKEIAIAITKINKVRQTKAGDVLDLSVKKLDTGEFMNVGCFLHNKEFHFNVGDEVLVPVSSKEWQGKTYYSCSLEGMQPMAKKEKNDVPKEVWEARDLRIARESVLDTAREIFKLANIEDKEKLNESDVTNMITMIGDQLVEWVYSSKTIEMEAPPEVE